jgi:phage baseplate assembly protein W
MAFIQPLIIDGDLNISDNSGFHMIDSLKVNIKQNLKMLILTNPGERVMQPNFGVGIRRFLFEVVGEEVYAEIDSKIKEQVSLYLPYLKITRVQFIRDPNNENRINLKIVYSVPRISLFDELNTEIL